METHIQPASEWTARALRPVARWVATTDQTGRTRLIMQWRVPDPDAALRQTATSATA